MVHVRDTNAFRKEILPRTINYRNNPLGTITGRRITQRLEVQLTEEQEQRAFKVATNEPEAFKNYMMGRSPLAKRPDSAIEFFEKAINIDPGFAEAYAGLANNHL